MSHCGHAVPDHLRNGQPLLNHNATVRVCQDPLLGGIGEALRWERIRQIVERYRGMVRVFLLIVDRNANPTRRAALDKLEQQAADLLGTTDRVLLAENAWQELEVWALAGATDLPTPWSWAEIRAHEHPKEVWYLPYAKQRGLDGGPTEGRDTLGKEAAANDPRVRQLCPEDVASLETRLRTALSA